jgi:hypothetical protein
MEDMYRLDANTMPFYIRDLNIQGFQYLWDVLEPIFSGYRAIPSLGIQPWKMVREVVKENRQNLAFKVSLMTVVFSLFVLTASLLLPTCVTSEVPLRWDLSTFTRYTLPHAVPSTWNVPSSTYLF